MVGRSNRLSFQVNRSARRSCRRILWFIAVAVLMTIAVASPSARLSLGLFIDRAEVQNSYFSADTLDAPTGLTATSGASIELNWTATTDAYASGHRVFRSTAPGGPYSQIAEVTPRTATTYTDSPAAGTYYYVVNAFYQNWESVDSNEVSATKN